VQGSVQATHTLVWNVHTQQSTANVLTHSQAATSKQSINVRVAKGIALAPTRMLATTWEDMEQVPFTWSIQHRSSIPVKRIQPRQLLPKLRVAQNGSRLQAQHFIQATGQLQTS